MSSDRPRYEHLRRRFRWRVPSRYNIAADVCDRWAPESARVALIYKARDGTVRSYGFGDIQRQANRLANALTHWGVNRGDRVGILLPQSPEAAVSHMAAYKLGAIAVQCALVLGTEALRYRLSHCGIRVLITDQIGAKKVSLIVDDLPQELLLVVTDEPFENAKDFHRELAKASDEYATVQTASSDPAFMIYTSGTTGEPKGILHAHQVLLGHLPGVELTHNFLPHDNDLGWTPSDWAWIGGLGDILLPFWRHGLPVLAWRPDQFDPEEVLHTLAEFHVRNIFVTPTALRLVQQSGPQPSCKLELRSIGCGGEPLTEDLAAWCNSTLGTGVNDSYGLTECNQVVVNTEAVPPQRRGSIGRAVPGHQVTIVDRTGAVLPPGNTGVIAIRRPDPVMFLGYWSEPEATSRSFIGEWFLTGDLGRQDDDGFFFYEGRSDDLIISSGYRIDPYEVEACIRSHPSVSMVLVAGDPDETRTQAVKALVVLETNRAPCDELIRSIQAYVKERLGAHAYPRDISFVDKLPLTYSGKIRRTDVRAGVTK